MNVLAIQAFRNSGSELMPTSNVINLLGVLYDETSLLLLLYIVTASQVQYSPG